MCSVAEGHGEKFKYIHLASLVDSEYDDVSNAKFCGSWWASAEQNCSVETHCPDGESARCPNQENCFDTGCNVLNIVKADLGDDWKALVTGMVGGGAGGDGVVGKMSPDDPGRTNFCGLDWGQASVKCTQWCRGNDEPGDCPRGQKCFADTSCYYDDDLAPTMSPFATFSPTKSPILRSNPANERFCGGSWGLATQNCSHETHCFSDKDCDTDSGHKCYQALPGCNLADMDAVKVNHDPNAPTGPPRPKWMDDTNDLDNVRFCGTDWDDAKLNCSLDRHCPDLICSDPGLMCFEHLSYVGAPHCNAYEIMRGNTRTPTVKPTASPSEDPTLRPTNLPTSAPPTASPTTANPTTQKTKFPTNKPTKGNTNAPVQIIHGLCADSFADLEQTYLSARKCSNINPCEINQLCYPNVDIDYFAKSPSSAPIMSPPTDSMEMPTYSPTFLWTYSPTATEQQTVTSQKPSVAGEKTTAQKNTQKPTTPEETQKPIGQITDAPSLEGNIISNEKMFLCAPSLEELKLSCGSALVCDSSMPCPAGQGCMQYNDCKQTQQKPDGGTQEGNPSSKWNYFPDLCPLGLVGVHSPSGDCGQYYDCQDGFLEASHTCELGFLFDNSRGKCISQKFVNSECTSANQMEVPDLCPKGWVGLHSPAGHDCTKYYDCYDGILGDYIICAVELKFDNIRGECVAQDLVDSDCNGIVLEVNNELHEIYDSGASGAEDLILEGSPEIALEMNNEQNQAVDYGIENDNISRPESVLESEDGEGNIGNSQSDSISDYEEEDETVLVTLDNYSPDLCPLGFAGFHAKEDCTKYYECTDGFIRSIHTCASSFKFDKVRNRCISGELVSDFCYGPSLETEEEQKEIESGEELNIIPPNPSPSSMTGGTRPSEALVWSNTSTPTIFKNESEPNWHESEPDWAHYLREYDNGEEVTRQSNFCLWMLALLQIFSLWPL